MARNIAYIVERRTRRVSGQVAVSSGTPSVTSGSGFTLTDAGAGKVTVNLTVPGKVILFANAIPVESTESTGHSAKVLSASASAVTFGIYVADGTNGALVDDVGFFFEILVKDVTV